MIKQKMGSSFLPLPGGDCKTRVVHLIPEPGGVADLSVRIHTYDIRESIHGMTTLFIGDLGDSLEVNSCTSVLPIRDAFGPSRLNQKGSNCTGFTGKNVLFDLFA